MKAEILPIAECTEELPDEISLAIAVRLWSDEPIKMQGTTPTEPFQNPMILEPAKIQIQDDLRDLLPPLKKQEFIRLEKSIRADGIREALVLWETDQGLVLVDGHHRLQIAKKLGIDVPVLVKEFEDRFAVMQWMWECQKGRRNWSPFTEVETLIKAVGPAIAERARRNELSGVALREGDRRVCTNEMLGKMSGSSKTTVTKVQFVLKHGSEDIIKRLRAGKFSINKGYKAARDLVREQERQTDFQRRSQELEDISDEAKIDYRLFVASMAETEDRIEDGSLDLIITDPPYDRDSVVLFEELAKIASKKLKSGGYLLCMSGQRFLPSILHRMSLHMRWHWMISVAHGRQEGPGGKYQQYALRNRWKPVLVFTNGGRDTDLPYFDDTIMGGEKDKDWHEWGQPLFEFEELVKRFSRAGARVWDPMCGGGTVPLACLKNNREFIASDIDPAAVERTRVRLLEHLQSKDTDVELIQPSEPVPQEAEVVSF